MTIRHLNTQLHRLFTFLLHSTHTSFIVTAYYKETYLLHNFMQHKDNKNSQGGAGALVAGALGLAAGAAVAATVVAHNNDASKAVKRTTTEIAERIRAKVEEVKAKLTDAQGAAITELESRFNDAQSRLEEMQKDGADLSKSALSKLEEARDELAGKFEDLAANAGENFDQVREDITAKLDDLTDQIERNTKSSS